jgi:hypothetical protein
MTGKLFCTAALLFTATALRAATFDFSFSGAGIPGSVTASGVITATETLPGIYTITGLTGTQNGQNISLDGSSTFIYSGSSGVGTLEFLVSGGVDTVTFAAGVFSETGVTGLDAGTNFTLTDPPSVSEAGTLSLLFTMGLGVYLLARKLPSRKHVGL